MGLSIGNIGGILGALRSSPQFAQTRLSRDPVGIPRANSRDKNEGIGPFFKKRDEPTLRAGFGQGTLSPSGAALLTINRTIEQVQRNIPTIEEIRARFRVNAAEAEESRRVRLGREERNTARRVEVRVPEASAQARSFISGINEAAGAALASFSGEDAPQREQGPTIRIGGESFAFGNRSPGTRLDVSV